MNVFVLGRENLGWSIDYDRKHAELFLMTLGYDLVRTPFTADVIHAVWWNRLLKPWYAPFRHKPIVAILSNDPTTNEAQFDRAASFVDRWVAPNERSVEHLEARGLPVRYQPFYVDDRLFEPIDEPKGALANRLGIEDDRLEDRLVIGSFQRDSLGTDLSKPKWQKDPELLVDILSNLDPDSYVLLLAGPRRHWLLDACDRQGIPYLYYGNRPRAGTDDIEENVIDRYRMNLLYNLIDAYLVTSASEGGPKAVLESGLTRTMILSTEVGLAPDMLDPWCLFETGAAAAEKLRTIAAGEHDLSIINRNYDAVTSRAGYDASIENWRTIYEELDAERSRR